MLAVGEWSKLGTLEGLVPTEDTMKILEQFDLGRFVMEFDELSERLKRDCVTKSSLIPLNRFSATAPR